MKPFDGRTVNGGARRGAYKLPVLVICGQSLNVDYSDPVPTRLHFSELQEEPGSLTP